MSATDSPFPVVDVHDEVTARQFQLTDRIGADFVRAFPDGLRCSVHELMGERAIPSRCGSWYMGMKNEPFPASFQNGENREGEQVWWRFPIRRDADGRWRALGGGVCSYYLDGEDIENLVREGLANVGRDRITDELVLAGPDGHAAVIPQDRWRGECSRCGLCCWLPREATPFWCDALEPGEVADAGRTNPA